MNFRNEKDTISPWSSTCIDRLQIRQLGAPNTSLQFGLRFDNYLAWSVSNKGIIHAFLLWFSKHSNPLKKHFISNKIFFKASNWKLTSHSINYLNSRFLDQKFSQNKKILRKTNKMSTSASMHHYHCTTTM